MSQKSSSARPPDAAKRPSTVRSLARLYPYVKPALPRIVLGMVAALLAAVVALLIPLVLQLLVDGPLSSGDRSHDSRLDLCRGLHDRRRVPDVRGRHSLRWLLARAAAPSCRVGRGRQDSGRAGSLTHTCCL